MVNVLNYRTAETLKIFIFGYISYMDRILSFHGKLSPINLAYHIPFIGQSSSNFEDQPTYSTKDKTCRLSDRQSALEVR